MGTLRVWRTFKTGLVALAASVKLSTHRQIKTQQTHKSPVTVFHTNLILRECHTCSRTTWHEISSFLQHPNFTKLFGHQKTEIGSVQAKIESYLISMPHFRPFRPCVLLGMFGNITERTLTNAMPPSDFLHPISLLMKLEKNGLLS